MTESDPVRLQEALQTLFDQCMQDVRLQAEAQRARREFFGTVAVSSMTPVQEHRFREWFLLERESDALGGVPGELAAEEDAVRDLLDSLASVFLVQADEDALVQVRDLQGDGLDAMEIEVSAEVLRDGDLLVGRLYSAGEVRWIPSAAIAIYRPGWKLGAALQRDFVRLGLQRRLSQLELEHLLLHRNEGADDSALDLPEWRPVEHIEADLQTLLGGLDDSFEVTAISEALRATARPGVVMGPLLDQLAFDTEVDLDTARRLLLELWGAHHSEGGAVGSAAVLGLMPESPGPAATEQGMRSDATLGERLVAALDAGLAAHEDVEELFDKIERMAGIDPVADEEEDPEELAAAARIVEAVAGASGQGNLGPLVEEFLWETGQGDAPIAASLQLLVSLQNQAPVPNHDLEELASRDLMRALLHVYLGAEPKGRSAAVRETFDAFGKFFTWAKDTQVMDLSAVLEGCRGPLLDQLDRLQQASATLSTEDATAGQPRPSMLVVDDLGKDGFGVLADDEPYWITANEGVVALLRQGDLLLGAMVPQAGDNQGERLVGTVVVLPSGAESLIG